MDKSIIKLYNICSRGVNFFGQLGLSNNYQSTQKFTEITSLQKCEAKSIHASWTQSLCLLDDNRLLIWGWPLDVRSQMQVLWMLKDYTKLAKFIQRYSPFPWISLREGTDFPQEETEPPGHLRKVSIGGAFVVACDTEGRAYAWGDNHRGQCGSGDSRYRLEPNLVHSLLDELIVDVKAGYQHSLFLGSNGSVHGCGRCTHYAYSSPPISNISSHGFSTTTIKVPVDGVTKIAGGNNFSVFLREDGNVFAVGKNEYGQCGQVSTTEVVEFPEMIYFPEKVVDVVSGTKHTLALGQSGQLYGFGYRMHGQIDGYRGGIYQEQCSPTPIKIPSQHKVKKVFAGFDRSAVILENGEVWVWGGDDFRYLDGEYYEKMTLINNDLPNPLDQVEEVALGFMHTLVMTSCS